MSITKAVLMRMTPKGAVFCNPENTEEQVSILTENRSRKIGRRKQIVTRSEFSVIHMNPVTQGLNEDPLYANENARIIISATNQTEALKLLEDAYVNAKDALMQVPLIAKGIPVPSTYAGATIHNV